jgi:hypothetical protein
MASSRTQSKSREPNRQLTDTEAVMRMLDNMAGHARRGVYDSSRYSLGVPNWYLIDQRIHIFMVTNSNVAVPARFRVYKDSVGIVHEKKKTISAITMLEYLADHFPELAIKLAEPIGD